MSKPITADDLFASFKSEPDYVEARAKIAPQTNLAININRFRYALGWTQGDLAREAGMRQPRIAELESGDANPRLETISRVALALGVEVARLFADPDADSKTIRSRPIRQLVIVDPARDDVREWGDVTEQATRTAAASDNFALNA